MGSKLATQVASRVLTINLPEHHIYYYYDYYYYHYY